MVEIGLNKLHRYVGIATAPFMVLQALSGLLLDIGQFHRGRTGAGEQTKWNPLLVKIHFGPGWLNDGYHLLLGAAIIWMALTGWLLYLRIRRARRKLAAVTPDMIDHNHLC